MRKITNKVKILKEGLSQYMINKYFDGDAFLAFDAALNFISSIDNQFIQEFQDIAKSGEYLKNRDEFSIYFK